MSYEWVLEPISDDEPCGPDLEATDDDGFVEYYYDSMGRLPERFVNPPKIGADEPRASVFDAKEVEIKDEKSSIDGLLEKSRDLRLLVLMARWECLAGRIEPLADCVSAIAGAIDAYGDDVHPNTHSGNSERRDTINDLGDMATMVQPAAYLPLNGTPEVTLHRYQVATGQTEARAGDDNLVPGAIMDQLGSTAGGGKVDAAFAALDRLRTDLRSILSACRLHPTAGFSPDLEPMIDVISETLKLITQARPDLVSADDASPEAEGGDGDVADNGGSAPAAASPTMMAVAPAGPIRSHKAAKLALEACERYFHEKEPSSAALLLVCQARHLIGKPLVTALEMLLPGEAPKAVIEFGPHHGFRIGMDRLKQLSDDRPPGASAPSKSSSPLDTPPKAAPAPAPAPAASSGSASTAGANESAKEAAKRIAREKREAAEREAAEKAARGEEDPAENESGEEDTAEDQTMSEDTGAPDAVDDDYEPPVITNRAEVAAILRSVEEFFHVQEKSSPVPILLQRARTYLEKDFHDLIGDLLPIPQQNS